MMPEDKMIGGIKSTNGFKPPKRQRKKKTDVERITEIREHLDKEQQAEETGHQAPQNPTPQKKPRQMTVTTTKKAGSYLSTELARILVGADEGSIAVQVEDDKSTNDYREVLLRLKKTE